MTEVKSTTRPDLPPAAKPTKTSSDGDPLPVANPQAAVAAPPPNTGVKVGGKTPFNSSLSLPTAAAAQETPQRVPGYQETFSGQSYVKDCNCEQLKGLMQAAASKLPELQQGSFAQNLASGNLGPEDMKTLQNALQAHGYSCGHCGTDGKYGPDTHQALSDLLSGKVPSTGGAPQEAAPTSSPTSSPSDDKDLEAKLRANEHNPYDSKVHQCFRYAWAMTKGAGGKGIDSAPSTTDGRGQPLSHLNTMIQQGKLKVGDVIYVNKHPGTDPGSHNLANGPHWFVYMGNGKFADQYNKPGSGFPRERTAEQMQNFVKGRKIDRIYHPFS